MSRHSVENALNPDTSFQKESPRWLINKGKLSAAHRIVFGKPPDKDYLQISQELAKQRQSIVRVGFARATYAIRTHHHLI